MEVAKHSRQGYARGCRCEVCCEASREYYRQRRKKPEVKEKTRAYHQRPEVKERCKSTAALRRMTQPAKAKAADKKRKLGRYGLSPMAYRNLEDMQGGVCAICWKPETAKHQNGETRMLSVDHDHEMGEVRGLLCLKCNRSLGSFDDSLDLLNRAVNYLQKASAPVATAWSVR